LKQRGTPENDMRMKLLALIALLLATPLVAWEPDTSDPMQLDVQKAIIEIRQVDPGIQAFLDHSAAYAVFPSVGKGGIVVGGAYGKGLVIAGDRVVGNTTLTQASVGLQLGGQKYSQFIFFKDDVALKNFQRGNLEFGATASAVAVTAGASADTSYDKGVAVFTHAAGGLMVEGSISGQKFSYEPRP
jgi:lipid-binding SYLF domain-containing protein